VNIYDVSAAIAPISFASPTIRFTAADDSNTLGPGDVLIVGMLNRSLPGNHTGDPVPITPPGDWSQDWYWEWTDPHGDGLGGAGVTSYALGFYSRVWTSGDDQSTYQADWDTTGSAAWAAAHALGAAGVVSTDEGTLFDISDTLAAGSYFYDVDGFVSAMLEVSSSGWYSQIGWARYLVGPGVLYVDSTPRRSSFDDIGFFGNFLFFFDGHSSVVTGANNVVMAWNGTTNPLPPEDIRISHNVRRGCRLAVS